MKDRSIKKSYEEMAKMAEMAEVSKEENAPPPLVDLVVDLKSAIAKEAMAKEYRLSIEADIESSLKYESLLNEETRKVTLGDLEVSFGNTIVVDQEKALNFEEWISEFSKDEEWKDRFTGYEEGFFKKTVKYSATQTELNAVDKSSDMWGILCDVIELKPKKPSFKFKDENNDIKKRADDVQRRIADLYKKQE